MNYSEMVNDVFNNYTSINPEFPLNSIIEKVNKLPSQKGFDTQFEISKGKINITKKAKH